MKKAILQFFIMASFGIILAQPIFPQGKLVFGAEIPFDFNIGKTSMPAGDYTIQSLAPNSNPRLLAVRREKSGKCKLVMVSAAAPYPTEQRSSMVFVQIEGRYYLTRLVTPSGSRSFSAEKEGETGSVLEMPINELLLSN